MFIVLRNINFYDIYISFKTANYYYFIPLFIIPVLNFAIRSLRWRTLFELSPLPGNKNLFIAMTIGYLANNVLPARTGEFVRVWMLAKYESISNSTVLATVVLERLIELVITVFLLYGVVIFFPLPETIRKTGLILGIMGVFCLFILFSLNKWRYFYQQITKNVMVFLPNVLLDKILFAFDHFVNGINSLKNLKNASSFCLYSAIIWILEILSLWFVAKAFNLNLSPAASLFILLSIGLGTIIPSSPGYIGTYEFFAISALKAINLTGNNAIAFVFVMHALTFLFPIFLGFVCLFISGQSLISIQMETEKNVSNN